MSECDNTFPKDITEFLEGKAGVDYVRRFAAAVLKGEEPIKLNLPATSRRERVYEFGVSKGAEGFGYAALRHTGELDLPNIQLFELPTQSLVHQNAYK